MSASNWKDRLSQKQLAKKRLTDKINQRRIRQQSKQETVQLEHRLSLLSTGDRGALINCLLEDNATLRSKISGYRSGMETIVRTVKDRLESDDDTCVDLDLSHWLSPSGSGDANGAPPDAAPINTPEDQHNLDMVRQLGKREFLHKSIYFQLSEIMGPARTSFSSISTNELLESIMAWKSMRGYTTCGLQLLLDCFALDQGPPSLTVEQINRYATSRNLFPDILENLLYGRDVPEPSPSIDHGPLELSEMQRQRRAVAFCAYSSCRPWRSLFNSALEYIVLWWADYRYYLFLVFPTMDNYEKIPSWRRPIAAQFRQDHPGSMDSMVWPKLRAHFMNTWTQYDMGDVYSKLVQAFEMQSPLMDHGSALQLTPDMSDLIVNPLFEKAIDDIENYKLNDLLERTYPELAQVLSQGANPPPLSMPANGSTQKRPYPCSGDETIPKRRH